MTSNQLCDYLGSVGEYIEYSFYKDSPEIMQAIVNKGFKAVFQIITIKETSKGVFQCTTSWETGSGQIIKGVIIDITGEMIYITEVI